METTPYLDNYAAEIQIRAAKLQVQAAEVELMTAQEFGNPSMMLKPKLFLDGNLWCALYGDNIQDGVTGFGSSPSKAYEDFDKNWHKNLSER